MIRPSEIPAATLVSGSDTRRVAGVIVTAREQLTRREIVLHRAGVDVMESIIETLERKHGDWRVLCISSPETVYRDLQGTRLQSEIDDILLPERYALGRVGRLDLLDPSLTRRASAVGLRD